MYIIGIVVAFLISAFLVLGAMARNYKYRKDWNNGHCKNGSKLKMEKLAPNFNYVYGCPCCKEKVIIPIHYVARFKNESRGVY